MEAEMQQTCLYSVPWTSEGFQAQKDNMRSRFCRTAQLQGLETLTLLNHCLQPGPVPEGV